jgi:peptidoglycan L-alanyl-D-glutamate endopeptidase CwlK
MMNLTDLMAKSEARITLLSPIVASKTRELIINSYNEGINILIVQGLRTSEEQAALYAQGRTTAGAIVTNANAGYSNHNYGLAIDYALLADDGYSVVWTVNDKWRRVAEIGKRLGFEWGGDWTGFIDYPHLEMCFGLSIEDLLDGKRPLEKEDYMILDDNVTNYILDVLGDYFKRMEGSEQVQVYTHDCANALRKAVGREEE